MRSLVARAPVRIDFGGGWTDVPPYCDVEGGCVCSVAIERHSVVRVRKAPGTVGASIVSDHPLETTLAEAAVRRAGVSGIAVELRNEFPIGAGLGGSSAAAVAMFGALSAWRGLAFDRSAIAEESRIAETEDLGIAVGRQDHYAAAFGGALELHFTGTTRVRRLPLSPETREAIERQCIVAYTGRSRISATTVTAVIDAWRSGTPHVVDALARMKELARQMARAIAEDRVDDLAGLVAEHWEYQRTLHPTITTPLIDELVTRAKAAGATGWKALGASGGGCMLAMAPEEHVERVRGAMMALAEPVPVRIDEGGLTWIAEE